MACFLGFRWHIVHRLFGIRKNIQQRLLLCIIGSIERRNRIKTTLFVKDKMHSSARQCTSLQINENDGKSNELRFNFLSHPPFYSGLALSSFYLFPNLKRWLQGWRISSSEENKWKTEGHFGGFDKSYYNRRIELLENCSTKCIELEGDHVKE